MTPTQVLAHLQRTFPDRLVLYAEDLAKVLGKSLRAVNRLLHQEDLPFKIKRLGEERCVDMFQVAEWLASDADLADEVSTPVLSSTVQDGGKVALSAPGRPKNHQTATSTLPPLEPVTDPEADYGLMGKRILAMRHDHQERWIARPKTGWTDDEWVFMHDLMTLVCMGPSLPVESFELVCARIDWVGAGYRREEKMLVALSEKAAREALKSLFLELNDVSSDAADIRVRHAGGEIFRAARNLEHWDIFLDDYELVPTS